ncbi:MAG: hypothetical protein Q8R00_02485, partial [Candidatus Nanoarchaeia archaeon]|nr:hypothetical protein [Candidatus Nanoarchaeia archaeon]
MVKKEELNHLSKDDLIKLLIRFAPHMGEKELPNKQEHETVPISVFNNKELSALETICKYLKENKHYNYHEIAQLLNRNDRTIWT